MTAPRSLIAQPRLRGPLTWGQYDAMATITAPRAAGAWRSLSGLGPSALAAMCCDPGRIGVRLVVSDRDNPRLTASSGTHDAGRRPAIGIIVMAEESPHWPGQGRPPGSSQPGVLHLTLTCPPRGSAGRTVAWFPGDLDCARSQQIVKAALSGSGCSGHLDGRT